MGQVTIRTLHRIQIMGHVIEQHGAGQASALSLRSWALLAPNLKFEIVVIATEDEGSGEDVAIEAVRVTASLGPLMESIVIHDCPADLEADLRRHAGAGEVAH